MEIIDLQINAYISINLVIFKCYESAIIALTILGNRKRELKWQLIMI